MVFTVSFDAARMKGRHDWRGAFLVRTADGFSRPVSVYAESDYEVPARPDVGDGVALYSETARGVNGFDLPKTGSYCILVRVREKPGVRRTEGVSLAKIVASLDGGEEKTYILKARPHWTWQLLGGRLSYEIFSRRR